MTLPTSDEIAKAREWYFQRYQTHLSGEFIDALAFATYAAHVTAEKDKRIAELEAALKHQRKTDESRATVIDRSRGSTSLWYLYKDLRRQNC